MEMEVAATAVELEATNNSTPIRINFARKLKLYVLLYS
jgi:hypothetical protein